MQAFSSTVRDMYALAEYAAPDQFLTQAINLLQMWIRFDGAIFGTGEGSQKNTLALLESSMDVPATTVPETIISTSSSPSEPGSRFANDPVARGFRDAPFLLNEAAYVSCIARVAMVKRRTLKSYQVRVILPKSWACAI